MVRLGSQLSVRNNVYISTNLIKYRYVNQTKIFCREVWNSYTCDYKTFYYITLYYYNMFEHF